MHSHADERTLSQCHAGRAPSCCSPPLATPTRRRSGSPARRCTLDHDLSSRARISDLVAPALNKRARARARWACWIASRAVRLASYTTAASIDPRAGIPASYPSHDPMKHAGHDRFPAALGGYDPPQIWTGRCRPGAARPGGPPIPLSCCWAGLRPCRKQHGSLASARQVWHPSGWVRASERACRRLARALVGPAGAL